MAISVSSQMAKKGFKVKDLNCSHCGKQHIDVDYYAVKPHSIHTCQHCGKNFLSNEKDVSNPEVNPDNVYEIIDNLLFKIEKSCSDGTYITLQDARLAAANTRLSIAILREITGNQ